MQQYEELDEEDYSWYLEHPAALPRAVQAVRKMHQTGHRLKRYLFCLGFMMHHTPAAFDALIKSGMPELLTEIILDEDTYKFIEPPHPGDDEEFVNVLAVVRPRATSDKATT